MLVSAHIALVDPVELHSQSVVDEQVLDVWINLETTSTTYEATALDKNILGYVNSPSIPEHDYAVCIQY